MKKNYCNYVDVFYGNGEVDHFPEDGLASKWFFIKALCGNTTPHAVLPFGKMSVGAYSGGYTSGYGNHHPNYCGGIRKIRDCLKIRGFSHLHQSGIGEICYYYNYAVVTPFYGDIKNILEFHEINNETARPGYYSVVCNDIHCELTVNRHTAYHRYSAKDPAFRVAVDFSNDGLFKELGDTFYSFAKDAEVFLTSDGTVMFSGILSGIKLYFCVFAEGGTIKAKLFSDGLERDETDIKPLDTSLPFGVVFDSDEKELVVKVSYSTKGYDDALRQVNESSETFDETASQAYEIWNRHLSRIAIETEDEPLKEKFYSNFYHSMIKPCDMTGETVLGISGNLVTDFATFWDLYKTQLPLIFLLHPEMGEKIAASIVNISRTLGKIPCSLGMTTIFPCEEQAKMLGILLLCDAYHYGIKGFDKKWLDECVQRELARNDFQPFLKDGVFERYTHILDTTDACFGAAAITENEALKEKLLSLAQNWRNAYEETSGLMSENSIYYEGDRYTYSFRLQNNIEERIALAGGKEKFVSMLDSFFGFGKESVKQVTTMFHAIDEINSRHYHRFEGFNNECDMETPYAYIYAGRHDRTCDVIHTCVTQSFTLGKGGIPGNNDSGGLSSCFVWNVIGLFPVSGKGEILLGSPHIKEAAITLSGGNQLRIIAKNQSKDAYYVEKVEFNGEEVKNFRIKTQTLMQGGTLTFYMKQNP